MRTDKTTTICVVVPTYNRADLLPLTLDTIVGQSHRPDEVIVVDDGSTDATAEVLGRYAPLVRHLRIENSGDLAARNVGLQAASTDLVAFCDSDDLWAPEFLSHMAALWQAEPRTRVGYADFVIIRNGQWGSESKFAFAPAGFWERLRPVGQDLAVFDEPVLDRLIRYQPFFPSCMVVNRRFLLGISGWDEAVGRTVGTDFATALRVVEHAPTGVVRKPLVGVRRHPGNYSADAEAMNLGDSMILEHVLATRPSVARYGAAIRASIGQRRRAALSSAFARRDFAAVEKIDCLLSDADRTVNTRVKAFVASMPPPLGQSAGRALLALGSIKSRFARAKAERFP